VPPDLDQLLVTLRSAADARMAERRQRRAQHAAAPVAPAVAKAQPVAAAVKPKPTDPGLVKARITEVAAKALAAKALIPQSPPPAAAVSAEDRRAQLRAQHQAVMQTAMQACREGRITVIELAELQAARLRADAALDGHGDVVEQLHALRHLEKQGG
jgi:hypothetical protein